MFGCPSDTSQDFLVSLLLLLVLKSSSWCLFAEINEKWKSVLQSKCSTFPNTACCMHWMAYKNRKKIATATVAKTSRGLPGWKASELMAHKPLSHTITPQYLGNLPSDFLGIFRKWTSQIFLSKGWIGRQHSCTSIKPWVSFELKRKSLSRHTDPNYCLH